MFLFHCLRFIWAEQCKHDIRKLWWYLTPPSPLALILQVCQSCRSRYTWHNGAKYEKQGSTLAENADTRLCRLSQIDNLDIGVVVLFLDGMILKILTGIEKKSDKTGQGVITLDNSLVQNSVYVRFYELWSENYIPHCLVIEGCQDEDITRIWTVINLLTMTLKIVPRSTKWCNFLCFIGYHQTQFKIQS